MPLITNRIVFILLLLPFISKGQFGGMAQTNKRMPETVEWQSQLINQEPGQWAGALDFFIKQEVGNGDWFHLDRMWIFASNYQSNARVSIINPQPTSFWPTNITEVNSPSWAALRGYTGNASSMYLNTNYSSGNYVNYSQNSASFGAYEYAIGASTLTENSMGVSGTGTSQLISQSPSATYNATCNSALTGGTGATYSTSLNSVFRTSSSAFTIYNRATSYSQTVSAVGVAANPFWVLCENNSNTVSNPTNNTVSMVFFGDGSVSESNFYNNFQTFATSIGFNK